MCSVIIHVNLEASELVNNSESSCKPEAVAVAEIPFLPMSRVHRAVCMASYPRRRCLTLLPTRRQKITERKKPEGTGNDECSDESVVNRV